MGGRADDDRAMVRTQEAPASRDEQETLPAAPACSMRERLKAQLEDERAKAQNRPTHRGSASAADFQNYKRRVEDERSETARLANAALVINLLPLRR